MAGNANSGRKADKLIRDALSLAVKRVHDGDPQGRIKLAIIAEKVVEQACEGDIASFREIADRIDGKAPQSLDITATHERSVAEWTEAELDAAIASLGASNGEAKTANGTAKSDRVH